jgi:hypothetical protein
VTKERPIRSPSSLFDHISGSVGVQSLRALRSAIRVHSHRIILGDGACWHGWCLLSSCSNHRHTLSCEISSQSSVPLGSLPTTHHDTNHSCSGSKPCCFSRPAPHRGSGVVWALRVAVRACAWKPSAEYLGGVDRHGLRVMCC